MWHWQRAAVTLIADTSVPSCEMRMCVCLPGLLTRGETRISNQTEFPPNAMKEMHTQICARHHICCQTSQAKTTFSLISASLSLFFPIYINKSLLPVLLPCDLLFRVAVLIIDERLSFALSTSKALHGPLNTHCSSCDPLLLLRIDWHSCHSVSIEAFQLISNPAGHQLGRVLVPNHPFQPFFFLLGDTGPVHSSSSGSITVGAFRPPEGLLHLWSHLSLRLTFPERSMHISIRQHLEKQIGGMQTGQHVG